MALNIHKILGDTLLAMCKTKKLEAITVSDIINETGISRQTFYNRFRDKNDLIQWTYEHNVLSGFLNNGPESPYYLNSLNYYKAINAHRDFMKQACAIEGQNCLKDFIFNFAIDYDLKWHEYYYGEPLPKEFVYMSWYHSVASITAAINWIESDDPEPPEVMARRITALRKVSLSDTIFGPDNPLYAFEPE